MKTFAFLYQPSNIKQIKYFWPITGILPGSFIKTFLKTKPFKIIQKKIKSAAGAEIEGSFIINPMLPDDIFEAEEELLLNRIVSAGKIAEKSKIEILGLGGYLSMLADKKPMIRKHVRTAVTSGSTFTAWTTFEAIFKTAIREKIDLSRTTVTIYNPTNAVGSLCARKFASYAKKIILTGGLSQKLAVLKDSISPETKCAIEIEEDAAKAAKKGDIIIHLSVGPSTMIDTADIKPQSLVCDLSELKTIANKVRNRKDLVLVDCDSIRLPLGQKLGLYMGAPDNTVCPYIAEVMLLAFENKIVNYSLGENINLDKLEEIANMAVKHGFEVYVPD